MPKGKVGRLAMRHEGDWWRAYFAMPDTMEGAIPLGAIRIKAADNEEIRQGFMDLMKLLITHVLEETGNGTASWPEGEKPAPEAERAGHG